MDSAKVSGWSQSVTTDLRPDESAATPLLAAPEREVVA
jgi:hypothetical protein